MNRSAFIPAEELHKLGFCLRSFLNWPLEKSLKFLSDTGYSSVELCLEHPELDPLKLTSKGRAKLRSVLDDVGLKVSAVSYRGTNSSGESGLKKLLKGADIALELESSVLIFCAGSQNRDPYGRDTFMALTELLQSTEEKGLAIAIEPEPDSVFHGLYEFSQFAHRTIGSPLRLNLNVAHAAITEGDVTEVIEEWASYIVHVHLSDIRRREHTHLLPGDGHLDLHKVIMTLCNHGYNGDWTIDVSENTNPPDKLAEQAILRCREILS